MKAINQRCNSNYSVVRPAKDGELQVPFNMGNHIVVLCRVCAYSLNTTVAVFVTRVQVMEEYVRSQCLASLYDI